MSAPADAENRLALARGRIARAVLDDGAPVTLGTVTLRPHQRDAVARLRRVLHEHGGALLADDAGLGKTYVALALACEARCPLVVAPAGLRTMWHEAMLAAGMYIEIVTHESLSQRGARAPTDVPDFVIVDEAHHARNPSTRRWRALAELSRDARLLLLSATPVHNRRTDLVALLSLFLGARTRDMNDAALARYVVRRERGDAAVASGPLPVVLPVQMLRLSHDDALVRRLVDLPPPLAHPGRDDGSALVTLGFVRQWASSEGAVRQALVRQLARAAALEAALREGRRPDSAELARWRAADDAVQLPFAALLAPPEPRADEMLRAVSLHAACVRDVVAQIDAGVDRDAERAARLGQLRRRHAGERIVAFSCYAGTVRALWRHLRGEPGVAALTSAGGVVAGGMLSREEVLHRFAPRAHGRPPARRAEDVSLLLATDLASEGVNLQDASVVVHLDLPWTAARLEQRVGRVARLGAVHDAVHVYAMAPPASAEAVVGIERRLREKLAAAAQAVGVSGAIVPPIGFGGGAATATDQKSVPRLMERTRERIARWRVSHGDQGSAESIVVAAVRAVERLDGGALVLVEDAGGVQLVAVEGGAVTTSPAAIARVVRIVDEGVACEPAPVVVRDALRRLRGWLRAQQGARAAGVHDIGAALLRRRAAVVAADALSHAPRQERARVARGAERLRDAANAARGAAAEEAMQRWLGSPVRKSLDDPDIHPAVRRHFADLAKDAGPGARVAAPGPGRVLVLVLLVPFGR